MSEDKLRQLYRGGNLRNRLLQNHGLEAQIITDLGNSGELGLLPDLVGYALHSNSVVRAAANRALSQLISTIPVGRLVELDAAIRKALTYWGRWDGVWERMQPAMMPKLCGKNDMGPLALATMHSNGRVRETALRILATREDGLELPFLLLRVNDWVVPLRELARASVLARVRDGYAIHFLNSLPLILRIERCERTQHRWLIEAVIGLLNRRESASVLQDGLNAKDKSVRRACLRFAAAADAPAAQTALIAALNDCAPMARLGAAKHLLATTGSTEFGELHARLARDPFMPVRRETLTNLLNRNHSGMHAALLDALLDRHPSVRELARFHLKGEMDAADFYRRKLPAVTGPVLVAAIRGLGECGAQADANAITSFLKSPEVRFRRAAVAAVGRLAAERMQDALLIALTDASPGVSAEACSVLRPIASALSDELSSLLKRHPSPFVRKYALRLICRLGKWNQLPLILAACRDVQPCVSRPAMSAVRVWLARYNRSYATPTESQIADATRELHQSQEFLDLSKAKEIESLIAEWKRR